MRAATLLIVALALAGCGDPVAEKAALDTRHDAVRSDTMKTFEFQPGASQLDGAQAVALRNMVSPGQPTERDEYVVLTDGSGGPLQQARAQQIRQGLSNAGARFVNVAVEPTLGMGPDAVVVAHSAYRLGGRDCMVTSRVGQWNPNESQTPGFGCADAYNMGQMMARPRDSALPRGPGPADGTVSASAVQRYHDGKVKGDQGGGGSSGGGAGASGPPSPGGAPGAGATPGSP
ncbi:MAG TPA: CpaD family pilus assembly lipoprotein [Reyranella sp.]|nr:CpaD family pilus assembly lipoprotein [Reyranella sp.]